MVKDSDTQWSDLDGNPSMVLSYQSGVDNWSLYTIGYIYQCDEPLSATSLEFYRDGGLAYTLERGDVVVSAGVLYEDMLSGALSGYYKKAETYSAAQVDTKKADKVKRQEVVEYGDWFFSQGDDEHGFITGTLSNTTGNNWYGGGWSLSWYGNGVWCLSSSISQNSFYYEGVSSLTAISVEQQPMFPITLTRRGYSSTILTSSVVYGDSLSAYATNDRLESLSGSVIRRDANTITTGGVVTDYLASNLVGGIRIRFSAHNLDNYTAYAYRGVAVRRNGATDDYLFDPTQANGIARLSDVSAIVAAYLSAYGVTA